MIRFSGRILVLPAVFWFALSWQLLSVASEATVPSTCPQFGRPSGGPLPGCACGTDKVDVLPWTEEQPGRSDVGGVITGKTGTPIGIRFEANPICRGQTIGNSESVIDWGDGSNLEQIGDVLQGCRMHTYKTNGNFNVHVRMSLVCSDHGAAQCSSRCTANGFMTAQVSGETRSDKSDVEKVATSAPPVRAMDVKSLIGVGFGAAALLFFMIAYFWAPRTHGQYVILKVIAAVLAGAAGLVLSGDVLTQFRGMVSPGLELTVSATGAIALFVLVWLTFPKSPGETPPTTPVEPVWSFSFPRGTTFRQAAHVIRDFNDASLSMQGFTAAEENTPLIAFGMQEGSQANAFRRLRDLVAPGSLPAFEVRQSGRHFDLISKRS